MSGSGNVECLLWWIVYIRSLTTNSNFMEYRRGRVRNIVRIYTRRPMHAEIAGKLSETAWLEDSASGREDFRNGICFDCRRRIRFWWYRRFVRITTGTFINNHCSFIAPSQELVQDDQYKFLCTEKEWIYRKTVYLDMPLYIDWICALIIGDDYCW